jgi:hypothetical protein
VVPTAGGLRVLGRCTKCSAAARGASPVLLRFQRLLQPFADIRLVAPLILIVLMFLFPGSAFWLPKALYS